MTNPPAPVPAPSITVTRETDVNPKPSAPTVVQRMIREVETADKSYRFPRPPSCDSCFDVRHSDWGVNKGPHSHRAGGFLVPIAVGASVSIGGIVVR